MSTLPNQIDPLDAAASSAAEAEHVASRIRRSKRLKLSILTSFLIRPLAVIIPIVTIPLFIRYLGSEERYGLYEAVGAVVMWLGIVNLGMSTGLVNKLTECDVAGDRERARLYVSTLVWAMAATLLLTLAVFALVTAWVDWAALFKITEPAARREVRWAVLVGGALTCLGLVTTIPSSIYAGYQEIYRFNFWDGASKVALILSCFALVFIPGLGGLGVVGVLLAVSAAPTVIRLVNLLCIFYYEKPWLRPGLRLFDRAALRVMLGHGLSIFALQVAVLALFHSDKLIISMAINVESVAAYAILGRLFLSVYGAFALILGPLWPAYGDAVRRGDMAWVRRQLLRTRIFGCSMMLVCGVFMFVFGNWVIGLLSPGADIVVSRNLIVAVTCMFIVRAWADSQSIALNAASVFTPQIVIFGGHACLNVIVAILLARPFGVEGVAWAASITGLLTTVWGYPWMVRRYLLRREGAPKPVVAEVTQK